MLAIGLGLWLGSRGTGTGGGGGGAQPSALAIANHDPDPMVTPVTLDISGFDDTYLDPGSEFRIIAYKWNGSAFALNYTSAWTAVVLPGPISANLSGLTYPGIYRFEAYGRTGGGASSAISNYVTTGVVLPTVTSPASYQVMENQTLLITPTYSSGTPTPAISGPDVTGNVTYGAQFEINSGNIRWIGNGTQDFEAPHDVGGNNVYNFDLTPMVSGLPGTTKSIDVTVLDVLELANYQWDPATKYSSATISTPDYRSFSGANFVGQEQGVRSFGSVSSGDWMQEMVVSGDFSTFTDNDMYLGIALAAYLPSAGLEPGNTANAITFRWTAGYADVSGPSAANTVVTSSPTTDGPLPTHVMAIFWSMSLRKFWVAIDGTWLNGNPSARTGGTSFMATGDVYVIASSKQGGTGTVPATTGAYVTPMPTGGSYFRNA